MTEEYLNLSTRRVAITSMLSALALILMYLEIPVPLMPSFIKFDFSDLPALIGAFALGPVFGVIIEFIKNIFHLVATQSLFIGELSNFILGSVFVFTAGYIYKKESSRKGALLGGLLGAVVMGLASIVANYFLVYPIYVKVFFDGDESVCVGMYQLIAPFVDTLIECLLVFNLPFTFLKGLISVAILMMLYKPLSRIFKTV